MGKSHSVKSLGSAELVLNPDGSAYHLHLLPGEIADTIILVGDPGRVARVSGHFDKLEVVKQHREFITHTGWLGDKRISVVGTGIGIDNVDIVINELDALVNIDFGLRIQKKQHRALNLIRLGTSGGLQPELLIDSVVMASWGLGLDGMSWYYRNLEKVADHSMAQAFKEQTRWPEYFPEPYFVKCSEALSKIFGYDVYKGITATAPGFYAAQGRGIRLEAAAPDLTSRLGQFKYGDLRICNLEMETSALYALAAMMGHHALTLCVISANRMRNEFTKDYHTAMDRLIVYALEKISESVI